MNKTKLWLPIFNIALIVGTTIVPLVSCTPNSSNNAPLCFSDIEDDQTSAVGLTIFDANDDIDLDLNISYSTNGKDWQLWYKSHEDTEAENITIEDGGKLYVKNETNSFSKNPSNYIKFTTTSEGEGLNISGNISYLLNKNNVLVDFCFFNLFNNCGKIINAKDLILPYKKLKQYCYYGMFHDCALLESAPNFPATTLTEYCYAFMFNNCTNLISAPNLPAKTLAPNCYERMFNRCSKLECAPNLPAKTLAPNCYERMFNGCSSLTSAPKLPATTLANGCYNTMFSSCSLLQSAPKLPATTLVTNCYYGMFYNCNNLKIKEDGDDNNKIFNCPSSLPDNAVTDMFTGCNSAGFTGTPISGKTYYWIEQ